jgi:uncharacterized protein with PQ loop repeat
VANEPEWLRCVHFSELVFDHIPYAHRKKSGDAISVSMCLLFVVALLRFIIASYLTSYHRDKGCPISSSPGTGTEV